MKTGFIHRPTGTKNMGGFSLIEVLVSVLVLTVGVIGSAMIQLNAFRTTEQSNFHDTAVALAMQIADEIRFNDSVSRQIGLGNDFEDFKYDSSNVKPGTVGYKCYVNNCTPSQLAAQSTTEWQQKVYATLPGGRLQICRDNTLINPSTKRYDWCKSPISDPSIPLVIKIGWYEKDPNGKAAESSSTGDDVPPQVALLVAPFTR